MKRLKVNSILIFLCCITWFSSCYESVEGCLDPEATNYEVDADNSCDDCCTLPTFSILMSYLVDGQSYTDGDTFRVSSQGLMIEDFHFFISGIQLFDPEGNEITYEDEFTFYDDLGNGEQVTEDFKFFASNQFRATLEGMRFSGFMDQIQFKIGLEENINTYDKDSLDANTELNKVPDEFYLGSNLGYEFYSFQIRDTLDNYMELRVSNDFPLPAVEVILDDENIRRGFSDQVNLFVDFGSLFDGVDLSAMDEEQVLEIVKNNFPFAFGKR